MQIFRFLLVSVLVVVHCTMINAQESLKVEGTVMDPATKQPLPFANVVVKGTTNGTVADENGNYIITVSNPNSDTLVFSTVGFLSEEKAVNGQSKIDVGLVPDATEIEELVVRGYGVQKKEDLTSSIAVVSTESIKNSVNLSSEQVLQGKATGVNVTTSNGAPGAPISVQIRGVGTPNNADPLYIVDGVPIKDASAGKEDNPSGINFLNPADIESIQILKDASAAAIYGTRGANGVIIITTKKGKSGEMRVNYNGSYGWQTPPEKLDLLNAQEFATLWNEIHNENNFSEDTIPKLQTTDWQDEVFRTAPVRNQQLSFSGGNDNSTFYTSFNEFNQKGILKHSSYKRYSVRLNSNHKVKPWLTLGENFTFTFSDHVRQKESGTGPANAPIAGAINADPTISPYHPSPSPDTIWNDTYRTDGNNPVGNLERQFYKYRTYRLQGNAFVDIDFPFLKGLKYKFNLGMDNSWGRLREFIPLYYVGANDASSSASLKQQHETYLTYVLENTLTYTKVFLTNHSVTVLGGYSFQSNRKENTIANVNFGPGIEVDEFDAHLGFTHIDENSSIGGVPRDDFLESYFTRLDYSYADKYLFMASFRRDASSRFGPDNRTANFPSFSLGWKISNENFMQSLNAISLLKLRGGWGQTGNYNINFYQYASAVSNRVDPNHNFVVYFDKEGNRYPILLITNAPLDDLKWETTKTVNFGLDLNLFQNKIQTTFDVFDKNTVDLLLQKTRIPSEGLNDWSVQYKNSGHINNKGFEAAITYKDVAGEFSYELGGNFTKIWNKVIKLNDDKPITSGDPTGNEPVVQLIPGKPLGVVRGYVVEGIARDQEDLDNHAIDPLARRVGDLMMKDLDGDGKITGADQTIIGHMLPDFVYGFNVNLNYRIFSLNIFAQGVYGNDVVNEMRRKSMNDFTLSGNVSKEMLNYVGRELDNGTVILDGDVPRIGTTAGGNNRFSSYYVEDGSYLRIKTVTFSVNVPSSILDRINFASARVYVTAQNLLTLSGYSGYDPEIGKNTGWDPEPFDIGIDRGNYPVPRTYIIGIDLSF